MATRSYARWPTDENTMLGVRNEEFFRVQMTKLSPPSASLVPLSQWDSCWRNAFVTDSPPETGGSTPKGGRGWIKPVESGMVKG